MAFYECCLLSLGRPLSYLGFMGCAGYALSDSLKEGDVTFASGSMILLVLLFTLSVYSLFEKSCHTILSSDFATLLKAFADVLFTTALFTQAQILGDAWDYFPLVLMVTLSMIYFMQGDCDRRFMPMYLIMNFFAQVYVGFKTDNIAIGGAALLMSFIQNICQGETYMGLEPDIAFNFVAGMYCLTQTIINQGEK